MKLSEWIALDEQVVPTVVVTRVLTSSCADQDELLHPSREPKGAGQTRATCILSQLDRYPPALRLGPVEHPMLHHAVCRVRYGAI